MVGATLLAIWILSASPGAAVSTDHPDEGVTQVEFRDPVAYSEEPSESHDKAPSPPPKALPRDPGYEGDKPSKAKEGGIRGLPPVTPVPTPETKKPVSKTKPAESKPAESKPVKKPAETKPREVEPKKRPPVQEEEVAPPLAPPEKAPPEKPTTRSEPGEPGEAGEAICTDRGPCGEAHGAPCNAPCDLPWNEPSRAAVRECRRGWLDGFGAEGWLDQGATINTLSPRNRINGPVGFNDRSNDYQLNQLYLRMGREVDRRGDAWDLGGRVDLLYGTDWIYTDARGLEVTDDYGSKWNSGRYGLAMPQAYMEAYSPWGNGLSMKLGHFYSILGYEQIPAPENFFYSLSYLRLYAEPATFTGFLGESTLGDFTIQAGMTRGDNNWDDNNNDLGFVGGIHWTNCCKRTDIALTVSAGREQDDPSTNIQTIFSLVFQQKLGERWQYVIQWDYGDEPGAGVGNPTTAFTPTVASWYGIDQYLFYTINDCWKAGLRFEWFRDANGSRVPGADQTADYYELTAGLNWTPNKHVVLRPEIRWDWTGTPGYYPFGDGTRSNQVLLDCDLIVRY